MRTSEQKLVICRERPCSLRPGPSLKIKKYRNCPALIRGNFRHPLPAGPSQARSDGTMGENYCKIAATTNSLCRYNCTCTMISMNCNKTGYGEVLSVF